VTGYEEDGYVIQHVFLSEIGMGDHTRDEILFPRAIRLRMLLVDDILEVRADGVYGAYEFFTGEELIEDREEDVGRFGYVCHYVAVGC
jgi:hypothetical protein